MQVLVLFALYLVPALLLFGATAIVARGKSGLLLPLEYGSWVLPGLVYAAIPALVYEARWHGVDVQLPPKSMVNLFEPILVAILCWIVFVVRIAVAVRTPVHNARAAYSSIVTCVLIAVGVLLLFPPLPE
jgi:hypothetical protein